MCIHPQKKIHFNRLYVHSHKYGPNLNAPDQENKDSINMLGLGSMICPCSRCIIRHPKKTPVFTPVRERE